MFATHAFRNDFWSLERMKIINPNATEYLSTRRTKYTKQNANKKHVTSKRARKDGVGDHLAWDIIIPKIDFESQIKMRSQNQRLANVVEQNADYELQKYRRHIRENKYM